MYVHIQFLLFFPVFFIRGGQIKAANKQWSSINNDYELTFSGETQIETCHEEAVDIIADVYNFVKFDKIADRPKDGLIGGIFVDFWNFITYK